MDILDQDGDDIKIGFQEVLPAKISIVVKQVEVVSTD